MTDQPVSDESTAAERQRPSHQPTTPHFEVVKGNPSDAELAALVTVLGKVVGSSAGPRNRNMWGHPVDKLRYPVFSWQRVTLLERTHLRR